MSDNGSKIDYRKLMTQSLRQLETAETKLRGLQDERSEPLAVIGMGCRFPGDADTPDEYWRLLLAGRDAISEVPADRWDAARFYDPDPQAPGKAYSRSGGSCARSTASIRASLAFPIWRRNRWIPSNVCCWR